MGGKRSAAFGLCAVVVGLPVLVSVSGVARASDDDVVLSEVMYHAPDGTTDDDDDYDFVELFNGGDAAVDLGGWQFTEGFDFEFPDTTVLAPGGFFVVAHDADAYAERYGSVPDAEFDGGKLKNSSELIELQNADGVVIDLLEYDDDEPWPGAADGDGRSLERLEMSRPNLGDDSDAANWLPSGNELGSPGAANTVLDFGPVFVGVDDGAERPAPDSGISVSASILNVDDVTITYTVGFGDAVTMPMADDESSVGGAGDGTFTAVLPGQTARTLVRYSIAAVNENGVTTSPAETDTVSTHGVVTLDPATPEDLTEFDWFITDEDYATLLGPNRFTDIPSPIVVAVGDQVIDDATIRVRGNFTRSLPKPSFRVELPRGKVVSFGDALDEPVDEFNLFRRNDIASDLGWEIADEVGLAKVDFFGMRVYRNGDFWSTGAYLSARDGRWREAADYDDAAVYKADKLMKKERNPDRAARQWEKKNGEEGVFTDIWELTNVVVRGKSDGQFQDLMETLDVPAVVNYWAYVSFLRQNDAVFKNHYWVRDPEGSGRWHVDLWDLNLIGANRGRIWGNQMPLIKTLNRYPEFRDMHARRLKSMMDSYSAEGLVARYDERFAVAEQALWDDHDIWRQRAAPDVARRSWVNGVPSRYAYLESYVDRAKGRDLPASQSNDHSVVVSAVNPAAADLPDVVEITNTSTEESFDVTDWTLGGVDVTLPAGSVLLPGATLVVTSDDEAYRAATVGAFAVGEFDELPGEGAIELRAADGALVDVLRYGSDDLDDDGVLNDDDNCPTDPNVDQADGDGDDIGDACDTDPDDGPLGDVDADGVANGDDNCPDDPNADQADEDADGVGDVCDSRGVVVEGSAIVPTMTVDVRADEIVTTWSAVEGGAVSYQFRFRVDFGPWTQDPRTAGHARTITDVVSGSTYRIQVRAKINGMWKPWNSYEFQAP